jgi:hypothetical protein
VAKPVARAVPVRAEPAAAEPIREEPVPEPAVTSRRRDRDDVTERATPQTKTALFVIAGLALFGCCGVSVLGFAFVQLTKKVADANKKDRGSPVIVAEPKPVPKIAPEPPRPVSVPDTPKTRPTTPAKTPPKLTPPTPPAPTPPPRPTAPADLPQAPSPQGMKGLKVYVSFNAEPIREDTTRKPLPVLGLPRLSDGPTRKAARFKAEANSDGGTPKFACDLSDFARSLTFKDDTPFTLALWVRGGGQDAVPFAATQASPELAPRLYVRSEARSLRIDFYCDKTDSEKRFSRTVTRTVGDMINAYHHVALARGPDGVLKAYADGTEMTDAPAESLPAKQPGEFTFRYAGFGLRADRLTYSFDVDEFCVFDRALSADELKTLAGKGPK